MKIVVMQEYDGFAVAIDGVYYRVDQEETVEVLCDAFRQIAPDADITFEEVY